MTQRSDNMETVKLTIEMLRRIPPEKTGKITAIELKDYLSGLGFERDLRSVQRHLRQITEHFDVECDTSKKPYRYHWKELASGLSLPQMNQHNSLLLALAEQHLKNLLPPKLLKSMDAYFRQAQANLRKSSKSSREMEWLSKVRVVSTTQPLLPPKIEKDVFNEICEALYKNLWLKIIYKNADGKVTESRVMPLGLAQQGVQMYLVCRFDGYANERSLALHRFVSAKAGTMGFTRPEDFDLSRYDDEGRLSYGDGKQVDLSFCIRKKAGLHLLEARLSEHQAHEEFDEYFKISATVVDSAILDRWLNSFGEDVWDISKSEPRKA